MAIDEDEGAVPGGTDSGDDRDSGDDIEEDSLRRIDRPNPDWLGPDEGLGQAAELECWIV
jgi:hypothetical protein